MIVSDYNRQYAIAVRSLSDIRLIFDDSCIIRSGRHLQSFTMRYSWAALALLPFAAAKLGLGLNRRDIQQPVRLLLAY